MTKQDKPGTKKTKTILRDEIGCRMLDVAARLGCKMEFNASVNEWQAYRDDASCEEYFFAGNSMDEFIENAAAFFMGENHDR